MAGRARLQKPFRATHALRYQQPGQKLRSVRVMVRGDDVFMRHEWDAFENPAWTLLDGQLLLLNGFPPSWPAALVRLPTPGVRPKMPWQR